MAKKLKLFKPKPKTTANTKQVVTNQASAIAVVSKQKKKAIFSAEDEARIQAEVERIKRAKHEQMIAEEIRNRVASI